MGQAGTLAETLGSHFARFIEGVRGIWPQGAGAEESAAAVCDRMVELLRAASPDEPWVTRLWRDRPRALELYRDPRFGFIQMGHLHPAAHTTAPHDHGTAWVVYGVYRGELCAVEVALRRGGRRTPNIMATTHICNWHKDVGSQYTYGVGLPPPDFERAACILLWGHNPKVSWMAHAQRINRARSRGAQLIVVDPRPAGFAPTADAWLRVRPGTDGALALGMIHVLLEEGLHDEAFVRQWTNGGFLIRADTGRPLEARDLDPAAGSARWVVWDERPGSPAVFDPEAGGTGAGVRPALEGRFTLRLADGSRVACEPAFGLLRALAARFAPERCEAVTWVPAGEVRRAARLFATAQPSCYCTYVGLEEHTNAMQTNRAICTFYALTGRFDAPGSNVLFSRPPTNPVSGREFLPPEQAAKRLGRVQRPLGPAGTSGSVRAQDVYRAILRDEPYPVRGLVLFGGNPLLSNAGTLEGRQALQALDFYVHVDPFVNVGAPYADLVLPACTPWECEAINVGFEMGEATSTWVQLRKAVVPPQHDSRSDMEIIFSMAQRLGLGGRFWNGNLEAAFNYELAPTGFTVRRLREHPVGLRFPASVRHRKYAEVDPVTGVPAGFRTPSRRIEIFSIPMARHGQPGLPEYVEPAMSPVSQPNVAQEYPLVLTMSKMLNFCHSQHRNIPTLRRQTPDPFVEIHPDTAKTLGVREGEWVSLETPYGAVRLRARFSPEMDPRVVATPAWLAAGVRTPGLPPLDAFGPTGANVNLLIGDGAEDPVSGSVPHRSYLCRVRPLEPPAPDAAAAGTAGLSAATP